MAPTLSYVAIVAIDFGTTYSGFAFSFTKGKTGIHMNREWGNDEGRFTMKTPTTILLRPNKGFESFGYEAEEKYSHFSSREQKDYHYFKHFKMELHQNKTLSRTTMLTAANGVKVDALTVFSLSLKYMKDKAFEVIQDETGDRNYTAKDIQWVITVPAIWTPGAKQFMREAAYQAGISTPETPDQLIIALEPEGAAIFCRECRLTDFLDQKGDATLADILGEGSKYLVMDIGGGTLDVTAHEILSDGTIREIHKVSGGAHGGIYVNRNFESLLERIFGIPAVKNYRIEHPADWHRLMNDFEMKKRGRRAIDRKDTRISLPQSFRNSVSGFDDSDLSARLSGSYRSLGVEIYDDEFLCLRPSAMMQLFQPVINGIVSHMAGLLCKPALSNLSHLFLVGGFAESAILQDEMKKAYSSRYKILTPRNAGIAVVQGATMFGKKPSIVSSRKMASTYGFETSRRFDPDKHPVNKKKFYDGVAFCKEIFDVVVKEDESVKTGEKKQFTRTPLYKDQTQLRFSFFGSSNPNVGYTTDPCVGPLIGEMIVDSPDTTKGIHRNIKLILHFGGTEIKATAVDDTSGNTAVVYLDFLCKS